MRRHRDLHLGEQVTGALRGVHTAPLDTQDAPGGRTGRDAQLDRISAEGRHLDRAPSAASVKVTGTVTRRFSPSR
jgi:hypothetical protein